MSTSLPDRRYWSERQGRGPRAVPLGLAQLQRLVFSALDELFERFYFQEAFGYFCVDADEVYGVVGRDANAWFLRRVHRDDVWPYREKADNYDADTLFDVLEALHDLVSEPIHGRYHDFAGCGWHYSAFDKAKGQHEFRSLVNPALERFEQPLHMTTTGEIIILTPEEFRPLLDAPIPASADSDLVTARVAEAKRIFQNRASTKADRRHAVRELADVLEILRPEIKEQMLPKDEREFFHIANGFAIRHNNREQRRDYDDASGSAGPSTSTWLRSTRCSDCVKSRPLRRNRPRSRQATEDQGQVALCVSQGRMSHQRRCAGSAAPCTDQELTPVTLHLS